MAQKIDCFKCQSFVITWDKKAPYGCKIFNFKTTTLPALDVRANSGNDCQFFKPKKTKTHDDSR